MYYFEIKSFLKDHNHIEEIYQEFHKLSHITQNKVGVSFPYQNNGLLNAIRFFSDSPEILRGLKLSEFFEDLSDNDNFLFSNVKEVPEFSTPLMLKRSRIDRRFSFYKLEKSKVIKTNCVFENGSLSDIFFIKIKSISTNQNFSIFYKYDKVEDLNNKFCFSSYGFSKGNSYVYHF